MTENAEHYITYFGGTILAQHKGVYLVRYTKYNGDIRYAVVKYHQYRMTERSPFDPIPLFDVTITEEHAEFFKTHLPAMVRFCEDEFEKALIK